MAEGLSAPGPGQGDVASRLVQAAAALEAQDHARCESLCAEALSINPGEPAAHQMRGVIRLRLNRAEEAEACFEQALRGRPGDPVILTQLAWTMHALERVAEADALVTQALQSDPGNPFALLAKAGFLEVSSRVDEVIALLEPSARAAKDTPGMAAALARALTKRGRADHAVMLLRRHLLRNEASSEDQITMFFALGDAYDRLDRVDEAFEAYTRAKRAVNVRVDPDSIERSAAELMDVYSRQNMARLPRAAPRSDKPVYIVGMPRSGSTLLERILDSHPRVHAVGEGHAFNNVVANLQTSLQPDTPYPGCVASLTQQHADRIASAYFAGLDRIDAAALRIVDKTLINFRHLGLIALLVPGARVIHATRDPLDCCWSCYTTRLAWFEHPWTLDLEWVGRYHRSYQRLMEHWKQTLDLRILDVPYEGVVADMEGQTRRMLEFCGLDWDDACLAFHRSERPIRTLSYGQVDRPIYADSVGRHRRYEDHLEPLKRGLAWGGTASR